MKIFKKILGMGWTLFFLVLPLSFAASQEENLSVKAEISRATLTIGERTDYQVTVTHDPSLKILSKVVPPPSDVFEVKEARDLFEKQGKQIVEGRHFVLTAYELGEFILDPVKIQYRDSKGAEKTIETNRLYITVRSVDSGKPKTDIRGPKGVLKLSRNWRWLLWVLTLLVVGGGGWFLGWRRQQKILSGEKAEEPPLSPEDEALLRLNRLFDSDLVRQGKMKEYFLEFSEILRRYFERRFDILAVESTTSEILRDLRDKELPQSLREKIREVLEGADWVKFAKWKPTPLEILKMNQQAKALIEEARPKVSAGALS